MTRLRIESLRFMGRGPIDLAVETGECVGLSGASGSGKTLFLRAVADLDPHEGSIYLDGVECLEVDAPLWRRRVGLLPAESQWWYDTVGSHFSTAEPRWLRDVDLGPETLSWSVSRLSTGERQRLALLRLLANEPETLLLDEPTASLDGENTERVERLIAGYRRQTGAAVLWVSHDPRQVKRVADRGFVLVDGRLREDRR